MRDRRGATLVLVALLLTFLVGMLGLVVDISHFYADRAQMQTATDAAVLAAALEVARRSPATAPDTARHYIALDAVDGTATTVPADSIQPLIWSFVDGSYVVAPGWTAAGVNGVRIAATYPAAYTFGAVWLNGTASLRTTAVAAVGYVGTTSCLAPWTVSYQTLLNVLYPPAGGTPVGYDLTAADITRLGRMGPANALALPLTRPNPLAPGNIQAVAVDAPWNGNASYRETVAGTCAREAIGPGSWLRTDPGSVAGQTAASLRAFCDAHGGTSGGGATFTCLGAPKVKLALWDITNGGHGANRRFRVKYVGVFAITSFHAVGGDAITGYFSAMASTGSVSGTPSPIVSGLLVQ
jgi:putative Flp pilus-assembly TadE/G-like protein